MALRLACQGRQLALRLRREAWAGPGHPPAAAQAEFRQRARPQAACLLAVFHPDGRLAAWHRRERVMRSVLALAPHPARGSGPGPYALTAVGSAYRPGLA